MQNPAFPMPYGRFLPGRPQHLPGHELRPSAAGDSGGPAARPAMPVAALHAIAAAWRRWIAGIGRWRQRRATYYALSGLNSHLLRDLGFDRSEIASVCAELTGDAEATRVHTLRARCGEMS